MENSIYLGLSKQIALSTDMQIISNNIANMTTPGYRGQNLVFEEFISDPRGADDELSFAYNRGQYQMTSPGSISATENPLDVALNGPGFIGVLGQNGETLYTRSGNFTLDALGTLTTSAGQTVSSQGGGAINIPPNSGNISIDARGAVSTEDGQVGQIMVVEFNDVQNLEALGNNTYRTNEAGQDAVNTVVKQGYLEGANVQPVLEMSRMIDTSRAFQTLQQTLQNEHERLSRAIRTLSGQN